ncbi:MAG: hypothetical protein ACE15D_14345 [Candidatus Eisenbacteria bacterium]|nr:hypothetical protein [Candidatus Eisenbacteria bacterium]
MRKRHKHHHPSLFVLLTVATGVLGVILAGCSTDDSIAPQDPRGSSGAPALLRSPSPLAVPLGERSTTKTIGVTGGEISVGEISIRFPWGALSRPVTFTLSLTDDERVQFAIAPANVSLRYPVTVRIEHLEAKSDYRKIRNLAMLLRDEGRWTAMSTYRDGDRVTAYARELGEYGLGERNAVPGDQMQFVHWLSGPGHQTELIRAGRGGDVKFHRCTVRIPSGALDEDTYITVRDPGNGYLMCELEPHGIVFNIPVQLEMDLHGLDTDPYLDWSIFLYDPATDSWIDEGAELSGDLLRVGLPHFSTYAAGRAGW